MKILALEFSSEQRSVAIVAAGRLLGEAVAGPPAGRATRAFALIDTALGEAGLNREEIGCIAIGRGPGSYMGIRVAIALAQGWQLARQVRLLGLSSADGIAAQAWENGLRGPAHVAIDAQRSEFYLAGYELEEGGCREVAPLRLAPLAEVKSLAAAGQRVIGPELASQGMAGSVVFPSAKQLGLLAEGRIDFVPGEDLAPIYLRPNTFVKAPPPREV
jgi:tRNA threonylcarbamoyl adenosine modification protein YeaZ